MTQSASDEGKNGKDGKDGKDVKAASARPARRKDVDALLSEVAGAAKVKGAGAAKAPATKAVSVPDPASGSAAAAALAPKTLRVRQVRSGICTPFDQKATLKALGLRRIRHEVELVDNPSTRGQILKVRHLVVVVGE